MRRVLMLSVMVSMLVFGCKKVDKFTQFDIEYNTSVTVPKTLGINLPLNLFTPDVETNSSSKFEVNDTRKDLIEEIILKKLELNLTSPNDSDLGFLNSIEVYIGAADLPEVMIASKSDIPDNVGKVLQLDCSDEDLKEYIKADEFELRLKTVTDEALGSDHVIDINTLFFVDAELLGI